MNLRLETEKEKVQPYYAKEVNGDPLEAEKQHKSAYSSTILADNNVPVGRFNALDKFYQKYNKVLLDKMALESEREAQQKENTDLRTILKVESSS